MLENLDYTNKEVVKETVEWGEWIVEELGLGGFRLDAVQHYSWRFSDRWTQHLSKQRPGGLFCVGEFWSGDVNVLLDWLKSMSPTFMLYDVPLLYKIARLSWFEDKDMREVFSDTLVEARPQTAVVSAYSNVSVPLLTALKTFIRIHDTQKGQDMDTPIRHSFTPHAYSLLLLRRDGHPCVFFGDLYGTTGPYPEPPTCWGKLPGLILARKLYAYGAQKDYFERPDCIGWVRRGDRLHPNGCGVVMSWTQGTNIEQLAPGLWMSVGKEHAGEVWTDVLGFEWSTVTINKNGDGWFPCQRNSMACFVNEAAEGRDAFPVRFDTDFQSLAE
jgi:alpha-amylase